MRVSSLPRASRVDRAGRCYERRGAAAVEFAVIAALILIPLILGLLEVGRALWVQEQLANAAREGARAGARPGATPGSVHQTVRDYLNRAQSGLGNGVTTTSTGVGGSPGTEVHVTAQLGYNQFGWVPRQFLNPSLQATVVMRKESST